MLKRCEPCDGYVEPTGEWVERSEGDIRYADAMTRDAPKTVAELADALRSPPETFREDLAELCVRHRRFHRSALEAPHEWLTVSVVQGDGRGYREGSQPPLRRVELTRPHTDQSVLRLYFGTLAVGGVSLLASLLPLPSNLHGLLLGIGLMGIVFPAFFGLFALIGFLASRLIPRRPRVVSVERRRGAPQLVVRMTDGRAHPMDAGQARLRITTDSDGNGGHTYIAWLDAVDVSAKLLSSGDRDAVRRLILQMEHVLGLDAPPRAAVA